MKIDEICSLEYGFGEMDSTILSPSSFCECFSFVAHHPNNTKFQVPKCPIHGAQ